MTACEDVTNDKALVAREKNKGWLARTGGGYRVIERYESELIAIDPVTGELKKRVRLRYPNYSGALATGGGLVFIALMDGTIAACCARTTSGQATAEQPSSVMNSRRFIRSPRRRAKALTPEPVTARKHRARPKSAAL